MMYVVLYLIAIVLANGSIAAFGPSAAPVNAFLFIAFDLTARDALHEAWHHDRLLLKMTALILVGSLLSAFLSPAVAVASFAAFAAAGAADAIVYQVLYKRPALVKMNASNAVSALIDSVVFIVLAFGAPVLWGVVVSSYAAKLTGGVVWSFIIARLRRS